MSRRTRRLALAAAGLALAAAVVFGGYAVSARAGGPHHLLTCAEADNAVAGGICAQLLKHATFSAGEVQALNGEAGAVYPVQAADLAMAGEMLALFLKNGVDINARNERAAGMTALHTTVMAGDVDRITLLLHHGARADVVNARGETALDLARLLSRRSPDDASRKAIVALLERSPR